MMKVKPVKLGKTERMSFSHIDEVISMPNLIEVQKNSYQWFLDEGLKEVFHDIGTIEDYTGNLALSFVDFRLDKEPKYSIKECKERDVTYAAPLRVTAKTRYRQKDVPAVIEPLADGKIKVTFDEPQRAITPGQAVVFYDGDYVVGGGIIAAPLKE